MRTHVFIALSAMALLPAGINAQDFESDGLYYNIINSEEAEVTKSPANDYAGFIYIPATVENAGVEYKVTQIGDAAFSYSAITDVQISNNVTKIGTEAFAFSQDLESVTLPLNLTEVTAGAFAGTSITAIAIPEGVKGIGTANAQDGAFQSCGLLETVFIPSSLTRIEAYGFNNCQSLREIYCKATTPPEATGWAIFIDLTGIDLIVPEESVDAYNQTTPWNDTETFSIWPPEDPAWVQLSAPVERDEWIDIPLGSNLAYKIYEDDRLVAITAAEAYRIRRPDEKTTYTIVPTNYFADSEPITYTFGQASANNPSYSGKTVKISAKGNDIVITGDYKGKPVNIYGIDGRLIKSINTENGIISGMASGLYIVGCGEATEKVVL